MSKTLVEKIPFCRVSGIVVLLVYCFTNFKECDGSFSLRAVFNETTFSSVLLFPPVNNYRRFLIHKTCEEVKDEGGTKYDLVTFSVGQGVNRRTVVCFKHQLRAPLDNFTSSDNNQRKEIKNWRSENGASESSRKKIFKMGVEKNNSNASGSSSRLSGKTIDVYVPPALRRSLEASTSNSSSSIQPIGGNNQIYVHQTALRKTTEDFSTAEIKKRKELDNASSSSSSTNSNCKVANEVTHENKSEEITKTSDDKIQASATNLTPVVNRPAKRERRPDRAVYIPRARRSLTTPPQQTSPRTSSAIITKPTSTFIPSTTSISSNCTGKQSSINCADGDDEKRIKEQRDSNIKLIKGEDKRIKRKSLSTEDSILFDEREENHVSIDNNSEITEDKQNRGTLNKGEEGNILTNKNILINPLNSQLRLDENCDSNAKQITIINNKETLIENSHILAKNLNTDGNIEQQEEGVNSPNDNKSTNQHFISNKNLTNMNQSKNVTTTNIANDCDGDNAIRIEDAITNTRRSSKCDADLVEMQRASKEINRSNRRIIKQTFNSDILEIPDKILKEDGLIARDNKVFTPEKNHLVENDMKRIVDPENDDWDSMFDDNGECVDPKILEELTASVGKCKIETPKADYSAYHVKQSILNDEEFPHVLEVSNFPVEFKTQDLMMIFSSYKESGFDIKWVDDTHALAVFSSSRIAAEVLAMGHPFVLLKPLAEATVESRAKAKKCSSSLQPYRPRPETCAALARRLVSGALGVRLKTAAEERENEKRVLREAKERKLLAAKQRDEAWES